MKNNKSKGPTKPTPAHLRSVSPTETPKVNPKDVLPVPPEAQKNLRDLDGSIAQHKMLLGDLTMQATELAQQQRGLQQKIDEGTQATRSLQAKLLDFAQQVCAQNGIDVANPDHGKWRLDLKEMVLRRIPG